MFYKFPRNQQKCCVRDKDAHNSFTGITGSCSNVHHWFHGLYHPNQSKSPAKYIRMEQHAGTQPKVPIPMCKITPDCAQEVLSGDGCFCIVLLLRKELGRARWDHCIDKDRSIHYKTLWKHSKCLLDWIDTIYMNLWSLSVLHFERLTVFIDLHTWMIHCW